MHSAIAVADMARQEAYMMGRHVEASIINDMIVGERAYESPQLIVSRMPADASADAQMSFGRKREKARLK